MSTQNVCFRGKISKIFIYSIAPDTVLIFLKPKNNDTLTPPGKYMLLGVLIRSTLWMHL